MTAYKIELLDGRGAAAAIPALAGVLIDCVEGGASVSFMAPLSREKAEAFWTRIAAAWNEVMSRCWRLATTVATL